MLGPDPKSLPNSMSLFIFLFFIFYFSFYFFHFIFFILFFILFHFIFHFIFHFLFILFFIFYSFFIIYLHILCYRVKEWDKHEPTIAIIPTGWTYHFLSLSRYFPRFSPLYNNILPKILIILNFI
jgi:hypothetical protein